MTLDEALLAVWRQALVENANLIELEGRRFPVRRTQRRRLRQVDFEFEGEPIRGIEQNPETKSRWAELARAGQKVMQFTSAGRYLANVAEGKLTFYRRPAVTEKKTAPKRGKSLT
jgi:fructose-1,6-bisphosphatase/inositol monophosphatase family enzyme